MAVVQALGPGDAAQGCEHLGLDDKGDIESLGDVVRAEREACACEPRASEGRRAH